MTKLQSNASKTHPAVGLFAYPWDIADRSIPQFLDDCAELGITHVHAAVCYHSGKFLLPKNRQSPVYFPEPGCVYFSPQPKAFRSGVEPPVSRLASTSWLEDLGRNAESRRIELVAWTVFFHNSSLGGKYPRLTVRNLFGNSYPFALCPSQSEVQDYATDLCRAIESLGFFSAIDLETIGYLGYVHGYHHEANAVPIGALDKLILSLCFCDACRSAGEMSGIHMDALQETLRNILLPRLRSDGASKNPQDTEHVATVLALMPELQALFNVRCNTVTKLVRHLTQECRRAKLAVFTSSFVGAPSNIWMEGISLPAVKEFAESCVLLSYGRDSDSANNDLLLCMALVGDPNKLDLALNLGLPVTSTLASASERVQYALERGIRKFSFFNYGFLGETRLMWVGQLSRQIRDYTKP